MDSRDIMMLIENAEDIVNVSKSNIEQEWEQQPKKELKYILACNIARKKYAECVEEVKLIKSELIRNASMDPQETCGKVKPTIQDVEAYYRTHSKYMKAVSDKINAEDIKNVLEDLLDLMHFTRIKVLETIVTLMQKEYNSKPYIKSYVRKK